MFAVTNLEEDQAHVDLGGPEKKSIVAVLNTKLQRKEGNLTGSSGSKQAHLTKHWLLGTAWKLFHVRKQQ